MTLILNGEFDFFPSKLCFILPEIHDFRCVRNFVLDAYVYIKGQQCLPNDNIQNILINLPRTPAYSLVTAGSRAGWGSCLCAWPPPTSSACSPPPLQGHLQVNLPGGGRALDTPCLNCLKKYIFIHYSISAFTAADVSLQFYASVQSVQLHNVG